jgi:hypothetical protein
VVGATTSKGGMAAVQASTANAQRGANGQPGGRLFTFGGKPGMATSSRSGWSKSGAESSSPFV